MAQAISALSLPIFEPAEEPFGTGAINAYQTLAQLDAKEQFS